MKVSPNYHTGLQLDLYCSRLEKRPEVPSIQALFRLSRHPDLRAFCQTLLFTPTSLPPPSSQDSGGLPLSAPPPPPYLPSTPSPDFLTPPPSLLPISPQTSPPTPFRLGFSWPYLFRPSLSGTPKPAIHLPLCEAAGLETIIRVQAPFSMSDLSILRSDSAVFREAQLSLQRSLNISPSPMTSPGETCTVSFLHVPIQERETVFGPSDGR